MKTITRRTFCKGAAAAASMALLPQFETYAASADGLHTLTFRSELSKADIQHEFYYSDSFFAHSALEYDHALALATLGLSIAAFNTAASDAQYWVNADVGRQDNLDAAFAEFGFSNTRFYNYDRDAGEATDTVGYGLARKTLTLDGETVCLVALILRGGGYGGEWVSNLHTGAGTAHAGFVAPVDEVFLNLSSYLAQAAPDGELRRVRLWIGGYSRGSIVANMVAARVHNELPALAQKNVFVYTFASPIALTKADCPELQQDYDNNHAADGSLKATWDSSNIFNIVSSGDVVARVLPAGWGYHRNGNDRFLPATTNQNELADLDRMGQTFGPQDLTFSQLATAEDTTALVKTVQDFCGTKQSFHEKYEAALMDMVECAFLRSEAEVTDGHILDDEEVVARLRSLTNMKQFPWWRIVRCVWAASTMSRPILEQLGDNVPLIAQQIIIPILAVGLCYGIETDVVKIVASYIVSLVAVRGEPDNFLRAAYCHHSENYISLMEYYAPSLHGMEPFTRK